MAYVVNNTRGQIIAVVQDGTVNTTATSQTLVGKNVTPYGEYEVENLVHQLENFANSTAPGNPLEGQLWYNTTEQALYAFSGAEWKTVSGLTVATTQPSLDPQVGELWFNTANGVTQIYSPISTGFGWIPLNTVPVASSAPSGVTAGQLYFNSVTGQLFAYDGNSWELIGPGAVSGFGTTQWVSTSMLDVSSVAHPVIQGTVDGTIVSIISTDAFTIYPTQRPAGFVSLVSGINLASGSVLNGVATSANQLSTARTINGVAFDGTANITVGSVGTLTTGTYLTGGPYNGSANATIDVNATASNSVNTVVARNSVGDFAAGTITANLLGSVSGTAYNVTGVVTPAHGGTGHTVYNDGEILIGNVISGLDRGTLIGDGPIEVTNTGSGLVISYTGGTGTGSVTSVGITTSGDGIGVSGSPVTTAGNITLTNTGVTKVNAGPGIAVSSGVGNTTITNTGVTRIIAGSNIVVDQANGNVTISSTASGGGGGSVTGITAGTGILASGVSGGTITGSGTISVDGNVVLTNSQQTISSTKTFVGGIISQAYNFTTTGNSIYHYAPYVAQVISVNNFATHQFYQKRLVVEGSADALPVDSTRPAGGAIVGVDNGVQGGAGLLGIHSSAVAGLGGGVFGVATNAAFTGAVFQGTALRPKSDAFVQIRSYSGGADPVFQVTGGGNVTADGTYTSPAADYAEYFEWVDSNPDQEDRVGITVALENNQIRPAQSGDTVIGVVSATPAMIGDAAELEWNQKYLTDEFGRTITEAYHCWQWTDEEGKPHNRFSFDDCSDVPSDAVRHDTDAQGNALVKPVLNPAFDPATPYVPRSQRPEWAPVGLVGKLRIRTGQVTAPSWIKLRDISASVQEWLIK